MEIPSIIKANFLLRRSSPLSLSLSLYFSFSLVCSATSRPRELNRREIFFEKKTLPLSLPLCPYWPSFYLLFSNFLYTIAFYLFNLIYSSRSTNTSVTIDSSQNILHTFPKYSPNFEFFEYSYFDLT